MGHSLPLHLHSFPSVYRSVSSRIVLWFLRHGTLLPAEGNGIEGFGHDLVASRDSGVQI
jgi:hypothetical protein